MFISGQRGLYDLNSRASSFYNNYLHSDSANCCVGVYDVTGVTGDAVGGGLSFRIQGGDGANNQGSHHVLFPRGPALPTFSYVDLQGAALALPTLQGPASLGQLPGRFYGDEGARLLPASPQDHDLAPRPYDQRLDANVGDQTSEGSPGAGTLDHIRSGTAALSVDTGVYQLVYFAFGFEAIDSFEMRQVVMARVANWLGEETGPILVSPGDGAGERTGDVTFEWRDVEDAVDYRIQIDTTNTFDSPSLIDAVVADTQHTVNLVTLGTRYWRVVARDVDLVEGPWSGARRLVIANDIVQVTPEQDNYNNNYSALVPISGDSLMVFYARCCWTIHSQASDDGGATWSESSFIVQDGVEPAAIQDPDGVIWLVYNRYTSSPNYNDIFYRTSNDDGQTWSQEQPLAVSPLEEFSPSIVRADSGHLIVTYSAYGNLPDGTYTDLVYYKTSDDVGATWSDPLALTESWGRDSSLTITSQGAIWLIYDACRKDCGIHYRTSSDNGDSWSPEGLLESNGYSPSIATSGAEMMIAFQRRSCSPFSCSDDIWYRVGAPENILEARSVRYTGYVGADFSPSVAALGIGYAVHPQLQGNPLRIRNPVYSATQWKWTFQRTQS